MILSHLCSLKNACVTELLLCVSSTSALFQHVTGDADDDTVIDKKPVTNRGAPHACCKLAMLDEACRFCG